MRFKPLVFVSSLLIVVNIICDQIAFAAQPLTMAGQHIATAEVNNQINSGNFNSQSNSSNINSTNSASSISAKKPLNIAVTIAPFYNIVAVVSGELNQLTLLVPPNVSMHGYSLKPSDVASINQADIIFWGGSSIEPFMQQAMHNVAKTQNIVAFADVPDMLLLPIRDDPKWGTPCGCAHREHHDHVGHNGDGIDPHIWLSIANAQRITDAVKDILSNTDPIHKDLYQENAKNFNAKLAWLQQILQQKFSSLKSKPYLVFHDAYQYLEHEYELNARGAITINPELPASANRIKEIREQISSNAIKCIFSEPQFQPKIVESLIDSSKNINSSKLKHGVLDPLGQAADLGANGYIQLLSNIADSLATCLCE